VTIDPRVLEIQTTTQSLDMTQIIAPKPRIGVGERGEKVICDQCSGWNIQANHRTKKTAVAVTNTVMKEMIFDVKIRS
jgi:hypothetical protein